jgi:hypothetical protein
VFLINVPLAAVVAVVALRHVPETRDPSMAPGIDVWGALTGALGLAGLTYGFTAWPAVGFSSPVVFGALGLGALGMLAFVVVERRSRHPMLPLEVFSSKAFTAANLVTLTVYAALGGVFFLVVLQLQVVSGYAPLAAGMAMLPITGLMLLLSARAGALAQRIGPRIPMTVGPLVCAAALVLFARIGPAAPYVSSVLPAVILLGLGLSTTVAPLTATALGSLEDRYAGIASGVNNAVARAAGLLAVATLPLAAGLGTGNLTDPTTLGPVYRTAMLICAGLLLVGAVTALVAVPSRLAPKPTVEPRRDRYDCAVAGTPLHPGRAAARTPQ